MARVKKMLLPHNHLFLLYSYHSSLTLHIYFMKIKFTPPAAFTHCISCSLGAAIQL